MGCATMERFHFDVCSRSSKNGDRNLTSRKNPSAVLATDITAFVPENGDTEISVDQSAQVAASASPLDLDAVERQQQAVELFDLVASDRSMVDSEIDQSDIPSLPSRPSEDDIARWGIAVQDIVQRWNSLTARSDALQRRAAAMVVMDRWLHADNQFYLDLIVGAGVAKPGSKTLHGAAVAWHFKLNVGDVDPVKKAKASRFVNTYGTACDNLDAKVKANQAKDPTFSVPHSRDGLNILDQMIKDAGGIHKLSLPIKEEVEPAKGFISISADQLDNANIASGKAKLANSLEGTPFLAVVVDTDNGPQITTRLDDARGVLNNMAVEYAEPDRRVSQLGELSVVSSMIREEATTLNQRSTDDADDASAPKRLTACHIVFHPGKEMTLSSILADTGLVVVVTDFVPLLGVEVKGHVMLRTADRRVADANLADPRRHIAFAYRDEAPGESAQTGVRRLYLSTALSEQPEEFGILVHQVQSKQGNHPLVVAPSFKPVMDVEVPAIWHSELIDCVKLGRKANGRPSGRKSQCSAKP